MSSRKKIVYKSLTFRLCQEVSKLIKSIIKEKFSKSEKKNS